ncbi:MAG: copper resistance CopC family protein, partial [Psychrobium sp.]
MKLLIQIALIVMVSISMQVFAHAGLKSSIPNDQERITEQPKNIVLEFNKPVRLLKVSMVDRKGEVVPLKYRMNTN